MRKKIFNVSEHENSSMFIFGLLLLGASAPLFYGGIWCTIHATDFAFGTNMRNCMGLFIALFITIGIAPFLYGLAFASVPIYRELKKINNTKKVGSMKPSRLNMRMFSKPHLKRDGAD